MSFFLDVRGDDQSKLKKRSQDSFHRALNIFGNTIDNGTTPYYDSASHLKSFAHPFYPIAQLARNALRLTYSAFVFVSALCTFNGHGAARALGNMCNIIIASVLEVFNTVFSILSLVSRSIVTGLNLGYTSSYSDSEPMKDGTAKPNEKAIHEQAFALV